MPVSSEISVQEAVEGIRENGYTIIQDFISLKRLTKAQLDAEQLLEPTPIKMPGINGPIDGRMCKGLMKKSRAFDDLFAHPKLTEIVSGYLAPEAETNKAGWGRSPIQLGGVMIKDTVPGESDRGFHRDDDFYPIPRPRAPLVVNSLLALDNFSEKSGGTRIVPKSHHWPQQVHQNADSINVEMPAGSIVIFDGSIWHTNGTNRTPQNRRAINIYFSCHWLKRLDEQTFNLTEDELKKLPKELHDLI